VLLCTNKLLRWLLISKEEHLLRYINSPRHLMLQTRSPACLPAANETLGSILYALTVDILITHMLSTEAADKLILFEFTRITIN